MDGRTYLEMKAISICRTRRSKIDVRLTFGEKPDQQSGLVRVEGEMEHTYDPALPQYMDPSRRDVAEIEVVQGRFNPKTREMVLLGIRRSGTFPKTEQPPPRIDEECGECDCVAFLSTSMVDCENQDCFCGHKIEAHKNRPHVNHLIIPARYILTLPESDLSEKFGAKAQCQIDPNHTAQLQFWEETISLKPAIDR